MGDSIFFIVTLVMTSVWLHRHRKAGGHCTPGRVAASQNGQNDHKNELPGHPQGEYPVASA
jgi:hypothetical protein